MPVMEIEVLKAVYALLNVDALTTGSGIDPTTGLTRAVALYNMVIENAPVPYVRLLITDSTPISTEPYEYRTPVNAKAIRFSADVFSDFHPEMLNISSVVQSLLDNIEITTPNYHGSTWVSSADNLIENVVNPDRIYQHASIRVQARMERA